MATSSEHGLLCVANFPAGTGYAWDFIEGLYAGVADRLAWHGVRTWVAYPEVDTPPRTLRGSAARSVELTVDPARPLTLPAALRFIRTRGIRVLYLADRPAWHPAYLLFRAAGVEGIVVHDHTSGARSRPAGLKRRVKAWSRRLPGALADTVIGVSDFVARRKVEVDLVPEDRVERVWNTVPIPPAEARRPGRLQKALGLPPNRPVVACACRAHRVKGVDHLLRGFDRLMADGVPGPRPLLVYMGDGPDLPRLRELRADLASADDVVLAGYRKDAAALLGDATACVVPSVWEEAFGLSALEPMARGVPVVATRVGGIPEVVVDGETGILVPPGDPEAIASALRRLLSHPEARRRMGEAGRLRAERHFSPEGKLDRLAHLVRHRFRELGSDAAGATDGP